MLVALIGVVLVLAAIVGTLGAAFGVVWWRPVKRHGIWMSIVAWSLTTLLVAGLGALRFSARLRHAATLPGTPWLPGRVALLYAAALGLALAPAAAALQWRARERPDSSFTTVLLSSAGWAMAGLVFACMVAVRFALARRA